MVWSRLRDWRRARGRPPGPRSIESWTVATSSCSPSSATWLVAVLEDLGEVVPGVDVHDREGEAPGPEGLHRQVQQDGRVLARR